MKLTKRILAGVVAAASVFGMAGCGNGEDEPTKGSTTTTVKATLSDNEAEIIASKVGSIEGLPDIELANKEVHYIDEHPMNPNDTAAADASLELFKLVYGGVVIDNVTTWNARYDDLAKLIMAGNAPDVFLADHGDGFPKGAIRGMFQPINDYIDYEDALWQDTAEAAGKFSINGNYYVAVIDVQPGAVCIYNRNTMTENGFDDPAELFSKGEWTLDVFIDMCEEFVDPAQDKYALDGFWYYDAIQQTCGVPMIGFNDEGQLVNNMTDPKIEEIEGIMYELSKSEVVFPRKDNNWATRGSGLAGDGIGDGKTLFLPSDGFWPILGTPEAVKLFGDVEAGEVMFVPMPLNTSGGNDTYYMSAKSKGYFLCKDAPNPEGFMALMYCKKACAMDEDINALTQNQLVDVYKWSDEMVDMYNTMYDMVLEEPVFDYWKGVSDEINTLYSNTICSSTMLDGGYGTKSWTQVVAEHQGTVDWLIKEANTELAAQT